MSPAHASTSLLTRPVRAAAAEAVQRLRVALSALLAGVLGIAPHVLHHVGPLAGAALFAGVGGTLLFGAIGLLAAVPFLLRVHRRCRNWRVPAALLATFAVMFSLSAFVIGPAIAGEDEPAATQNAPASPTAAPAGHQGHH